MYFETDYRKEAMKDHIEKEMQRYEKIAVEAISRIAHFEQKILLGILSFSFFEENQDAMKLADKLNLGKLEFFAINNDYDSFKELYLKNQEYELGQQQYDEAQNF